MDKMYSEEFKEKVIRLSWGKSAEKTIKALQQINESEDEKIPDARTIRRWKNQALKESNANKEPPREYLIAKDALWEKKMDFPSWAKT